MNAKELRDLADSLFTKKAPLNSLFQEIADNFFVERADFTLTRSIGTDFASHLMSSYPMKCRRDLGNQFGTMLRPTARPWFHTGIRHETVDDDNDTKVWLEWVQETQRRAMYDRKSLFVKTTKQGDHDFAAFGQCALSIEPNRMADGLLYRCWHLRDMAWQEDEEGEIGFVARKWKPTAQTLVRMFGDKVDPKITEANRKTPFDEFEVMHFVCNAEMYDDTTKCPRWSIWFDTTHNKILKADGLWGRHYIIPRWQTVSGSQYSYSPATVCALPDARLLQAMTFTLLEAGEKATSPPMIATQDAVRSDVALYAGGITWVDQEYDERLGDALRPLTQDFRGFNFGVQLNQDTRLMLHNAFFLDALTMPQRAPEMTAYEVGQRVQEYIRNALPVFEPMEQEYNAALCDETFSIMWRHGAFGSPSTWPNKLRAGAEIDFTFESPLHDAIEEMKGQQFQQAQQLIGMAMSLDPSVAFIPKAEVALRDALKGIGVPSKWLNNEAFVADAKQKQQDQQAAAQRLAAMEQGSNVVKNLGQAGVVPQEQAGAAQRTTAAAV